MKNERKTVIISTPGVRIGGKTHCRNGHEYRDNPRNWWVSNSGRRPSIRCKDCEKANRERKRREADEAKRADWERLL